MRLWLPRVPGIGHPGRKWGRGAPLRAFGQNPKRPALGSGSSLWSLLAASNTSQARPGRQEDLWERTANEGEPGRFPTPSMHVGRKTGFKRGLTEHALGLLQAQTPAK